VSRDYANLRGISAYEVLGVPEQADAEEIRLAHRRLIAQIHPDHAGSELFAQLVNDAKHVLVNERADYDAWRRASATSSQSQAEAPDPWNQAPKSGSQSWAPPSDPPSAVNLGPRYVATDGRPPYFVPPGAMPHAPRPPLPPSQPNPPFQSDSQDPAKPLRYGPQCFSGRMRQLAEEAQREVFAVLGTATNDAQRETYIRTADFLAALRIYRDIVAAAFTDDLISAGLAGKPAHFLAQFIHNYRQAPPSPERDQAISVISSVDQSPSAGVLVAMTRLTIEKRAGRM
jgi:curved DNA-binding protein CbpA